MAESPAFMTRGILNLIMAGWLLTAGAGAQDAKMPTEAELLTYLRLDQALSQAMRAGKIVSTPVTEATEKELAVGVVMFLPVPVTEAVEFVRSGKVLSKDEDIIAFGELPEPATRANFDQIRLGPEFRKEAAGLLEAGPGSKFNLAADEIAAFRALRGQIKDKAALPDIAKVYRELLFQRYQAYRAAGVGGIAGYDRGGGRESRPGEELQGALRESKLLADHFPELHRAIAEYPRRQPANLEHRFFWVNQKVEGRPTLILSHRFLQVQAAGAVVVLRQYYVGHSYNSLEILAGCLPVAGGVVVFYSNHTSTDQVTGFGHGMKRSIGRGQMREEVIRSFEQIRESLRE